MSDTDAVNLSAEKNTPIPIPTTVWLIGMMMFLANLSYIMVYSLAGVYLKTVVGVSMIMIVLRRCGHSQGQEQSDGCVGRANFVHFNPQSNCVWADVVVHSA